MRHQPLQPISPSIEAETGLAGGSDESGMAIAGTSAEDEGGEVDGGGDEEEVQPPPPHTKFQGEKVSSPAQMQK